MCGRFVSTTTPQDLVALLGELRWDPAESFAPSWNVAPTDPVPAVLERLDRESGELLRQLRRCAGAWCRPGPRTPPAAPA